MILYLYLSDVFHDKYQSCKYEKHSREICYPHPPPPFSKTPWAAWDYLATGKSSRDWLEETFSPSQEQIPILSQEQVPILKAKIKIPILNIKIESVSQIEMQARGEFSPTICIVTLKKM